MRWRGTLGVVPIVTFVVLFGLLPVAVLFATTVAGAGGAAGVAAVASDPLDQRSVVNSLIQGGLSAGCAAAVGYPAGVFLGRYSWRGRSAVRGFLLVPFLLPSLVVVLGVLDLFGPSGLLSGPIPVLGVFAGGTPAIVAANLFFNVPIVVLFTAAGCEAAAPELEETVATLGGGPFRAYRDAWGPPTWVGGAVGGLLTFLFSALSFAPPLLLCGTRCYTVEARIYSLDQVLLAPDAAGVLALLAVGLFLVPTLAYLVLLGRLRVRSSQRRRSPRPADLRSPAIAALAVVAGAVTVAEGALLAAILARTLVPVGGGGVGSAWATLFSPATATRLGLPVGAAVGNTLFFATAASLLTVLLGLGAAHVVARRPRRGILLGLILFVPLLLSPVVLAYSLAEFWRPLLGGAPNVWLLIVLSQTVLALPFAVQSLTLPLAGLSPAASDSARCLGASPWVAYLDADLPRARDGLLTAGLFAFALGLGEFTATFFLVTPQFTTLPVALYGLTDARAFPIADAAAGLLLLLSLAVFLALSVGGRRVEL